MKPPKSNLERIFVKQLGAYSCGLACISMISRWYGGDISQEQLRNHSGTTLNGTSMLGLCQAAQKVGFSANGFECSPEHLAKVPAPVILHVQRDNLLHYVVFFGLENGKYIIGDPAWGILYLSDVELSSIWKSNCLIELRPTSSFVVQQRKMQSQWRWFVSLIKEDIPILAVSSFLGLLIALTGLSTAIFSQKLIDDFLPEKNLRLIGLGLILLGVMLVLRAFLGYIQGVFMARQARDLNQRLVASFIAKTIRLPITFFRGVSTGDLIARMNDSMRIRNAVSVIASGLVVNLLVIVVSLVYLFYYSWQIGLLGLTGIVVYYVVARKFHRPLFRAQRDLMGAHAVNESQYIESLTGISTIKSYGKEHVFSERINGIYAFFQTCGYKLALIGNSFSFGTQLVAGVYVTLIFAYCVWLVIGDQLQLGEMMALVGVGGSLIPAIAGVAMVNIQVQEARVAFDRLYEMTTTEPEDLQRSCNVDSSVLGGSLEISNLSFRYPGRMKLLRGLSFRVEPGEIIAIFGKIGCGKSTLLDVIQGFYTQETGQIRMGDCSPEHMGYPLWRSKLAVVAQHEKVFNTTVLDNIAMSNDPNEVDKVLHFLSESGFAALFDAFSQGILTLCGEEGRNLSGGQRQLVCLARALYKQPNYLFLDESTSAMDFDLERVVVDKLSYHCKNKQMGLILVTHRLGLAKRADRILIMSDGCIGDQGSHSRLVKGDNLYAKAYQSLTYLHETV